MSNVSKEAASSLKTWLLIGLICNIVSMIPYLNTIALIPTIICTILGMNKAVSLLSGETDDEAQKFFRGTKLLRKNYIFCIILFVVMLIGLIVFGIVLAATTQNPNPEDIAAAYTGVIFLIVGLFAVYYYAILIWALVHWFKLNSYLGKLAA